MGKPKGRLTPKAQGLMKKFKNLKEKEAENMKGPIHALNPSPI